MLLEIANEFYKNRQKNSQKDFIIRNGVTIYCYMINGETLCDESTTAQNINSLRKDKVMLYPGHIQSQSNVKYSFLLV